MNVLSYAMFAICLWSVSWSTTSAQEASSGKETVQTKTVDLADVRKLLQASTPLVLLWVDSFPSKIKDLRCWKSSYSRAAAAGTFTHNIHGNWLENTESTDAKLKRHEAEVTLELLEVRGIATLTVTSTPNTEFVDLIKGNYHIFYVSSTCIILRGPVSEKYQGLCTAWVSADTASFVHKKCKEAFMTHCTTNEQCNKNEGRRRR
nr:uncharacterized protein LOC126543873 isoform X1 [Dermacentor andersoni]